MKKLIATGILAGALLPAPALAVESDKNDQVRVTNLTSICKEKRGTDRAVHRFRLESDDRFVLASFRVHVQRGDRVKEVRHDLIGEKRRVRIGVGRRPVDHRITYLHEDGRRVTEEVLSTGRLKNICD